MQRHHRTCVAGLLVFSLIGCRKEDVPDTNVTKLSVARQWNEELLDAIRLDKPAPTIHSRNLFHISAAMYDAWATYDVNAKGYFFIDKYKSGEVDSARREAISYAAYRMLLWRYRASPNVEKVTENFTKRMLALGYDPSITNEEGTSPSAVGNKIASYVIAQTLDDGSNEANAYTDTTNALGELEANPILEVVTAGVGGALANPDMWQRLKVEGALTQNGQAAPTIQQYVGPHWNNVTPFALNRLADSDLYQDPGTPPRIDNAAMKSWVLDVIRRSSMLDSASQERMDISPSAVGNNTLGTNDGNGYQVNPATGNPYSENIVKKADFGRVLAEFWADGPHSETPPGHWNVLANEMRDHSQFSPRWLGEGEPLDSLEWDVKTYLTLNGALHDAAIVAWGIKRKFLCTRPISLIRYMAGLGQSSDSNLAHYNANGLPLEPGLVELITTESSASGQRHADLRDHINEVALFTWSGQPDNPSFQVSGPRWVLGTTWVPYQLKTFVSPAFPGFISGHSTFSRAAAEVLTKLTGTSFFPGGLKEFVAKKNATLKFESGPSEDITLQWATYFDAADQAGQSRLWSGIHIEPDDLVGRRMGHEVGLKAVERAQKLFQTN